MVQFTADDDLRGAQFVDADMPGARFRLSDLSESRFEQSYLTRAVMRGVDLTGADIDGEIDGLTVNGVEVQPLVEAALNERFPGREHCRSADPAEQLASFDAAQVHWAAAVQRATVRPELRDARVDDEWSVAQTLRHLVLATDGWLRRGLLGLADAFHPFGVPFTEWDEKAPSIGIDMTAAPSWEEVLAVRADRVRQVRDFLSAQTPQTFAAPAPGLPPWYDDVPDERRSQLTFGYCMGVIGNEEWAHLRFALRDLDAVEGGGAP